MLFIMWVGEGSDASDQRNNSVKSCRDSTIKLSPLPGNQRPPSESPSVGQFVLIKINLIRVTVTRVALPRRWWSLESHSTLW